MNHKKGGLGFPIVLGIFGFFWAGGLSLAAGNSMVTSLLRGALGLFGLFALGLLVRFAFHAFVNAPTPKQDQRGAFIDVALPEQSPEEQPPSQAKASDGEFVPLANALKTNTISDEEARKMAEALRHLDD